MKKVIFILLLIFFPQFMGCDLLIDSIINELLNEDELEIKATGEVCVSDHNTYYIDSGQSSVTVSFTGFSKTAGTHYKPKVRINSSHCFSSDEEIKGSHSVSLYGSIESVEIYAELRQNSNPTYYDTAYIKLTNISVR